MILKNLLTIYFKTILYIILKYIQHLLKKLLVKKRVSKILSIIINVLNATYLYKTLLF
jgi:hypothetical protein